MKMLRLILAAALVLLPLAEASAGSSTITTKDAAGATKTFFVTTDGGGNFYSAGVICDQSAAAACASVGTAGSPSTNALTVQAVTLGSGTAANAMRVELANNGTGVLATVGAVTTVSTVTNLAQMNGAALLMGNGVTGTGSQRVTVASDNTAFSVNAVQSGTWNTATLTTLTGGGVASGSADSGNPLKIGCKFNAAILALTDGNRADCQSDSGGNGKLSFGIAAATLAGWTSGTAGNATQVLMANHGAPSILVQLNQTTTISAGATTLEGTYDGTNWVAIPVAQILNPNTLANLTNPYTLVASTNQPFLILTQGYQSVRIRLSTAITGSATVTPFVTLLNYNPAIGALLNPLAAGSAIIGKVGIDQTTPGTTNAIRTTAGATGGGTISSAIAPATPAGVNLKASAGSVFKVFATTVQSTPVYVKLYNASSAPTCGSGTPVARFMVPAASTAANGAGTNVDIGDIGAAFGTGIGYCVTGALADADTTAITANNTLVNVVWN